MPPTQHSRISPSSLERTILCPPSLLLNEQYPEEETKYTAEGTVAHAVSELALYSKFNLNNPPDAKKVIDGVTGEMFLHAMAYADFVKRRIDRIATDTECSLSECQVFPELTVHLDQYIPGCYGTSDCAITSPERIAVIDYKYGVNRVPAQGSDLLKEKFNYTANVQLSAYALGVYSALPSYRQNEIELIEIYIYQPRAKGGLYIGGMGIKPRTLVSFAETVRKQVDLALVGGGERCAGSHCRFCKHKNKCPEYLVSAASGGTYRPQTPNVFIN